MRSQNRWTGIVVGVIMGVLFSAAVVVAGSLEPSAGPTAAVSQMYTLEQIYNRINNGAAGTKMTTFTEPSNGPTAGTIHTLDEIYNLVGLRAPVPKTGQTTCYNLLGVVVPCAGTGQDGQIMAGVAWPNPRFTDNLNGTVTDNLTGLIWLKDANCTIFFSGDISGLNNRNWANALTAANLLANGRCGLNDGSTAGQWRLPNVREMQSLIDFGYARANPALPSLHPFTGVQPLLYWSSTTHQVLTDWVWYVSLYDGTVFNATKTLNYYVWPVRGGQ